jgi:hypothetical protein
MNKENYTQLCVWQGVSLGDKTAKELEDFFMEKFGTRVKYKGEVTTLPDLYEILLCWLIGGISIEF